MRPIYRKGVSVLFGLLIVLSLVYINVGSTRAASAITGVTDAVWYDANENGTFDPTEGIGGIDIYLDNSGIVAATTLADGSFSDVFATVDPGLDWDGDHYLTFKADGFRTVTYNVSNIGGAVALPDESVQMILQDSIYGRVVGNDGPLAGITVEALVYGTGAVASDVLGADAQTVTDQYGNFVLKGLPAATYDIRASKDEYIAQLLTGVRVIYGKTTKDVNFSMTPNYGAITGHVSDGAIPLQGAVVSIPGLGLSAVTDANGQYTITDVMAGSYTMICEKDGYKIGVLYYDDSSSSFGCNPADYSPFVQPGPSVTPTSADFNLEPEPLTPVNGYVSGILTEQSGRAIECGYVTIPGLEMERCTDKGGFYIFEDVPNGEYDVVAQDPNPNTEVLEHKSAKARINVVPGENSEADFSLLGNPGFIVGQITDKDALPVNGGSVTIPNSTISSLTDLNGWYALEDVNVNRYSVYDYSSETISYFVANVVVKATGSDFNDNTLVVEPIPANGAYDDTYNITIIKKTGVIKGQLYEIGTGQPIEDARVRVYGREAITDASGVYEFVGVPVGSYTVVAGEGPAQTYTENDYDLVIETDVWAGPGTQTMLDFYLPDATHSLYGYVSGVAFEDKDASGVFTEGEGVSGLTVEVPGYPTVETDDFGFYIVSADAGTHYQAIYGGDYEWQNLGMVTFVSNLEDPGNDIELTRRTGELVGRVTEGGAPVESANLWVPQYENDWAQGSTSIEVLSDVYGNYAFADDGVDDLSLDKGRHLLVVQRWDDLNMSYEFDLSFVTIASTISKDVALTRETGRVEGLVWDDLNGDGTKDTNEPLLPDAEVSLSKVYSTTSDSTGYYTILDVPVTLDRDTTHLTPTYEINRYTGIAYLTGYDTETFVSSPITAHPDIFDHTSTATVEYEDCNNIEVFEDIVYTDVTMDIDFPLDKADPLPVTGSVSGYVNLGMNLIHSEAEVWIEGTNMNTWSDIEGFWLILDATPGNYAIQAGKPNYVSQIHSNVPVIEGFENENIDYSLEKDGFIFGTVFEDIDHNGVKDPTDVPIQGAIVTIANRQVYTDSNGEFIIDNLYANAPYNGYTVTATKLNYTLQQSIDVEVIHADATGTEVDFLLERYEGFFIGKVSDHSTMDGIVGIEVYAMDDSIDDNTEDGVTDSAGYYVIVANRGTYTLQAPKEPNATGYVTKEVYDSTLYGFSITRENFVLWDETTMPDNNVFGIVYRDDDDSGTYDDGEEVGGVTVSIPGLDMTVISATDLTDPDGTPGTLDEYNFIFMDVPNNGGYQYTLTAKMAIPGTSPTQYIIEYIEGVSAGATQWEIGLEWPPTAPYDSWIEGIVFWDMNDNGIVEDNERLPGKNVFIPGSSVGNVPGSAFLASVTDSTGYYIINDIPSRIDDVPVFCTVLAQEPSPTADYEVGIQRNLPVQSGLGDWIDFPLERTTSYTAAYIFGEVYFDENSNDQYDVDDSPSTEGIANATLTVDSQTESTDIFGFYIFDGLTANETYLVEVSANGYEDHSEYETAALGYNANIDFQMEKLSNSISGFVFEDVNENGIKDAGDKVINAKIVAVKDGGGNYEAFTDITGFYLLPNLPIGDYDIECTQLVDVGELPEYQDWTYLDNPVTVDAVSGAIVDIPMARYYVDVEGTVTDSDTSQPVINATIAWYSPDDFVTPRYVALTDLNGDWSTSSNADPDDDWNHADLDGDGTVDAEEVGAPVGTWYVVFSATGYTTTSKWVVLDWNDVPGPVTIDLEIDPTPANTGTLEGVVTNDFDASPIENATITATNQTTLDIYATQSLADGSYSFDVPEGTYDLVCSRVGFDNETVTNVVVAIGATVTNDFAMTASGGLGDVVVNVDDDLANPLDDVLVTLWYQSPTTDLFEIVVDGTTTGGTITFIDVPAGTLYVCASDNNNDRIMETEEITLLDNGTETVDFALEDGTSSTITLDGATSQWYLLSLPVLVRDDTFWPALLYASGIELDVWDMAASWNNSVDAYEYYDQTLSRTTNFWLVRDPALTYEPGVWMHMEAGTFNLKVVGEEVTTIDYTLPGGHWTLVAYPMTLDGNPLATALAQNPADSVNLMWTYDIPPSAAKLYDPRGRFVPPGFTTFDIWHAYWVFVDVDCTLTITS